MGVNSAIIAYISLSFVLVQSDERARPGAWLSEIICLAPKQNTFCLWAYNTFISHKLHITKKKKNKKYCLLWYHTVSTFKKRTAELLSVLLFFLKNDKCCICPVKDAGWSLLSKPASKQKPVSADLVTEPGFITGCLCQKFWVHSQNRYKSPLRFQCLGRI